MTPTRAVGPKVRPSGDGSSAGHVQRASPSRRWPTSPVLRSTIFQRDDIVVRLIDARGGLDATDPALSLGLSDPARAAEFAEFLDDSPSAGAPAPKKGDPPRLRGLVRMDLVTDRRSPDA